MFKTFMLVSIIIAFTACGNNKPKTETPDALDDLRNFSKVKMTREDTLTKEWLL